MAKRPKQTRRVIATPPRHAGGRPRQHASCKLGQRIEELASVRGLALDDLASSSGVTFSTLHRIRSGQVRNPSAATLCALATALEVPVDRLTAGVF